MCNRFALTTPRSKLVERFGLSSCVEFEPRHDIAPLNDVLVIRCDAGSQRVGQLYRWGLLPWWARDASQATQLTNARGETLADKPSFKSAFRRRRCIIPADGFFEWQAVTASGRTLRQPFFIQPAQTGELFAFAGLTERWFSPDGEEIHSCCIITTVANALVKPIHERMPLILPPEDFAAWLDPANHHPDTLRRFIRPADAGQMSLASTTPDWAWPAPGFGHAS